MFKKYKGVLVGVPAALGTATVAMAQDAGAGIGATLESAAGDAQSVFMTILGISAAIFAATIVLRFAKRGVR